jgi:Sensors of blue-light using FAD
MSFVQMLYVSRSQLSEGREEAEVAAILAAAWQRNQALGLTGCLASWGPWFVQLLEGSAEAIDSAMVRIAADPRHADLTIRLQRDVKTRSFPSWQMAHVATGPRPIGNPMELPVVILLSELMRLADVNQRQ